MGIFHVMSTRVIHAFDTLLYAKKLKKAGFSEAQAEVQAEALADIVNNNLATKHDLKRLGTRLLIQLSSVIVVAWATLGSFLGILISIK